MSLLTYRKIAVLKFTVFVLHEEKPKGVGAHFTSSEKASSVPGRMHTAVVESSGAANPRVPVLKLTVLSLSPTLAGRDLTWWRLKSHMGRGTPQTSRSPRPFLLAEPAQNSNRARHCEPLRGGHKPADLPVQQPTKFSVSVVCSGTIGRSTLSVYWPLGRIGDRSDMTDHWASEQSIGIVRHVFVHVRAKGIHRFFDAARARGIERPSGLKGYHRSPDFQLRMS